MASTYTNNGIELITTGEQSGTWGTTTNTNWNSAEAMITGYVDYSVTDASTKTETIADGAADDFRNKIIKMTGTLSQAQTITIADTSVEKEFWVYNGTTGGYAVTFKQGTGANTITINNGNWGHFFVNGANDAEFFTPEQFTTISVTSAINPDISGGADLGTSSLEWGDVYVADNKFVNFGSDQDVLIGWNTTRTGLDISATEGAALALYLSSDQGDDAGDEWKLNVADGGTITLGNDINSAGTFVTHLTITPNSTVASSTVAFAGNITVAGTFTPSGTLAASTLTVSGDATFTGDILSNASGSTTIGSASAEFAGIYLADDSDVLFGNDQDYILRYSTTQAAMTLRSSVESAPFTFQWASDQDDDAGDKWEWNIAATGGVMTLASDISSADTFVTHITFTPNSTASSSIVDFVGQVTAVGFTGTLDGILGGGAAAAATVTTLTGTTMVSNANGLSVGVNSISPATAANQPFSVLSDDATAQTLLFDNTGTADHIMAFHSDSQGDADTLFTVDVFGGDSAAATADQQYAQMFAATVLDNNGAETGRWSFGTAQAGSIVENMSITGAVGAIGVMITGGLSIGFEGVSPTVISDDNPLQIYTNSNGGPTITYDNTANARWNVAWLTDQTSDANAIHVETFAALDSSSAVQTYTGITSSIVLDDAGAETGKYVIRTAQGAGVLTDTLAITGAVGAVGILLTGGLSIGFEGVTPVAISDDNPLQIYVDSNGGPTITYDNTANTRWNVAWRTDQTGDANAIYAESWAALDSGSAAQTYAGMVVATILDNAGAETGRFTIQVASGAGSNTDGFTVTGDLAGVGTILHKGAHYMVEIATPTARASFGAIYPKTDNKLYFQDGAGTEHELAFA